MSAQSKIPASKQMQQSLPSLLKNPKIRALKIVINEEQMEIEDQIENLGEVSEEFDSIEKSLEADSPCYYLISVADIIQNQVDPEIGHEEESPNSLSVHSKWLNVLYVPESAPIRSKMLFSSSKQHLITLVGSAGYKTTYFATMPSEVSLQEIAQFIKNSETSDSNRSSNCSQSPLPSNGIYNNTPFVDEADSISISQRSTNISNLDIELTSEAKTALHSLHIGKSSLVTLSINQKTQAIELDRKLTQVESIEEYFSIDEPRFGYFLYKHSSNPNSSANPNLDGLSVIEDNTYNVPIFIYCCPESANIKLKMVYSTIKSSLLNIVHTEVGLVEKLRIEVSSRDELTSSLFLQKLGSLKISSTVNSNASSSMRSTGYFEDSYKINKQPLSTGPRKFLKPAGPSRNTKK